ncbi:MAG: tRNA (guanosine(37)-N1)-methyltransferase TrmD [Candidatus Gracilibacteria bacterium]|jgi:tRNA (guanine37-N1)-methyltransferase
MHFTILTLFPSLVTPYFSDSILARAIKSKKIKVDTVDIRTFSKDKHKKTDDTPYGGGPGMVMTCQPLYDAICATKKKNKGPVVFLSPAGQRLTQDLAQKLSKEKGLILVCGRYEGVDQRVIDLLVDMEISLGDFVLTGGELPALAVVDSVARLIPGVLGDKESASEESFSPELEGMIEYPQYTKPEVFKGVSVPKVLLSGNHALIHKWRHENCKLVASASKTAKASVRKKLKKD